MNGKRYSWQGIAKLPFIDEARLLCEIAKVEHTLTAEEKRRNSIMSDMLFVAVSHSLSPYIFSLDDRCKKMNEKERFLVKEKLDPKASGGMNGHICLCAGDPCPPTFKSPVAGMEDIVDNQVICAIYELPDYHKHRTRPPTGVRFPKKLVSMGDLKESVLWHEDYGRRPMDNARRFMENGKQPMENGRPNPPGSISGRQLGEAAHRLVISSLQRRSSDQNGYGSQVHAMPASYTIPGYGPTVPYPGNRYHDQDYDRTVPQTHNRHNQHYTSLTTHHRQHHSSRHPTHVGPRQNGPRYLAVPAAPVGHGAYHDPSGYSGQPMHQSYGVGYSQWAGGPQSRGYGNGFSSQGETVFRHLREEQIEGVMAVGKFLQS